MTADEFREWKERHQLSISDLQAMFEKSRSNICYWLNGKVAVPKLIAKLCAEYDRRTP